MMTELTNINKYFQEDQNLIKQLDVHVEQTISQIFRFHDLNKILLEKVLTVTHVDIIEEGKRYLCNCCYMEQVRKK